MNDLIESIPEKSFQDFERSTGCPAYHPRMMMKIILCAYTQVCIFRTENRNITNRQYPYEVVNPRI